MEGKLGSWFWKQSAGESDDFLRFFGLKLEGFVDFASQIFETKHMGLGRPKALSICNPKKSMETLACVQHHF